MVRQQRHAWTNSQIIWKGKLEPSAAHHDIKPQHQCRLNASNHDMTSAVKGLSQQSPSLGLCRISANKT